MKYMYTFCPYEDITTYELAMCMSFYRCIDKVEDIKHPNDVLEAMNKLIELQYNMLSDNIKRHIMQSDINDMDTAIKQVKERFYSK